MCGIFLAVQQTLPPLSLPAKSFDEREIAELVSRRSTAHTQLSEAHKLKVKNAQNIREKQIELAKLGVKNHSDKIAQLKAEISALQTVPETPESETSLEDTLVDIMARGPDYAEIWEKQIGRFWLRGLSSVLSLRQPFQPQPWRNENYIFQFNGELYNEECLGTNDGDFAFRSLAAAQDKGALLKTLSSFSGEFAFVLIDRLNRKVYFGKDLIGKRSLLFSIHNGLQVGSILSHCNEPVECEPGVLYEFDVESQEILKSPYQQQLQLEAAPSDSYQNGYSSTAALTDELHAVLKKSCLLRQQTVHPLHPTKTQVAILFSGGLDCTILAALLAENYTSLGEPVAIDLLTVGFENPRTGLLPLESPDRQLSERLWLELSRKFANTNVSFRLVQVDVAYGEFLSHRGRVLGLIRPTATEMDLSIAVAFYFASRRAEFVAWTIENAPEWAEFTRNKESFVCAEKYTSTAKVLFSGLGADELWGGYSRHEGIFDSLKEDSASEEIHQMYYELSQSLLHDINVIYQRNLGRDDRAISSWGKELRYPYLDNDVVEFSAKVPSHYKVRFEWTTIQTKKGAKRTKIYSRKFLLRELCRSLGLPMAAGEEKRAIQFGAKLAKLEVGQSKARGTDRIA